MVRQAAFVLKTSVKDLVRTDSFTRAAAVAFYAVTSFIPVLVVAIAIAAAAFGEEAARGAIVRELSALVGQDGAELIQTAVLSASRREAGAVASMLGILTLLVTTSGVFVQLRRGLNALWNIEPPREALSRLLRARLASFGLVIAFGLLLLISLVFDALVTASSEIVNSYLLFGAALLRTANALVSFVLTALLLGAMYTILTANKVSLRNAALAAVVTALLLQIGSLLIGIYLGTSGIGSSLGAAGALIALLFWIYYSAVIVFFGAALTRAFTLHEGKA